jgi:phage terminase large subunit-like protein
MTPSASRSRCSNRSRKTIGEYNFAGQYQQAPAPLGGVFKSAWFRHYMQDELPVKFDRIVQSWDTANKASELSDFSVCTSWVILGKDLYLLDVLRRRMEYPELKRAVREQYARFRPSVVLIEDKASGTQLIQELVAEDLYAVTRYQPQSDKVMRMHAHVPCSLIARCIASGRRRTTPSANERASLRSVSRLVRASVQRHGITGTIKRLPERIIRIGFEIGHLDHDPVWTASVADLCTDPLS